MKQNAKNVLATFAILFALAVAPAGAAEGRTPIWEPVAIMTPGKYIVTRDIAVAAGPVIDIMASDVDIDLNGMRLQSGGANPVINGAGQNISVRNGIVIGGASGITMTGLQNVTIEDVQVMGSAGPGIEIVDSNGYALRRNQVLGCGTIGINVAALPGSEASGLLQDNHVIQCQEGINLDEAGSTIVKHNRIEEMNGSFGIRVGNSFGVILDRNTVLDTTAQGIWVEGSFACKLYNNTVLRAQGPGIDLAGTFDSLLLDNVVSQTMGDGMVIAGDRNHIEGNVLNSNGAAGFGYGLLIFGADNVYRGNTARGNAGPGGAACGGAPATPDICDAVAASDSFGDNFMPFLL